MEDPCVVTTETETGPGWRELLEALYAQIEAGQEREAFARERERFLTRLLEEERRALQRWRGGRPRAVKTSTAVSPRERSPLHTKILGVLASQPAGLQRAELEAAVGTQPLGDVLQGLCRRGALRRLSKGVYALVEETTPPGQEEEKRA